MMSTLCKHTPVAFAVLTIAAMAGCLETAQQDDQRYGQILPPGEVEDCPEGCVAYVTAPADTLYFIAQRLYGKGYKMYLIQSLKQNEERLKDATKPDGSLEEGKIIFLPPDQSGKMLDPARQKQYWEFGGKP